MCRRVGGATMTTLYKLDERRTCRECGKSIVYTPQGWFHARAARPPHIAAPVEEAPPVDMEAALRAQITALHQIIAVKDDRIQTLLEANRELAGKVRR